jgi:hypothetical protein
MAESRQLVRRREINLASGLHGQSRQDGLSAQLGFLRSRIPPATNAMAAIAIRPVRKHRVSRTERLRRCLRDRTAMQSGRRGVAAQGSCSAASLGQAMSMGDLSSKTPITVG